VRALIGVITALGAAGVTAPAWAHSGTVAQESWLPAEPWVLATLALTAITYAAGFRRLRRRSGDRIATTTAAGAFAASVLVLLAVLASPADHLSAQLFSAHMVQHLVLMLVAAPLLVWGRTAIVLVWAMPRRLRRFGGSWWAGTGLSRVLRTLLTHPLAIWIWFCGIFGFWHLPRPYAWALENEAIHVLEHAVFLLSAVAFWSVVIEPLGRRRLDYGASLLFVATAAIVSSLPGALMILASRPLYDGHAHGAADWGLTLVQDQQLGGLIMWIPAGIAYLAAISILFVLWLQEAERRSAVRLRRMAPLAGFSALLALGGCDEAGVGTRFTDIGDPERGALYIEQAGCGSCHEIPGIDGAEGLVGPPLDHMGKRIFIAGLMRNTPANMMTWLQNPQEIVPGNAMPDMGITDEQARDITAYLYTLQ
jgi:putative membrane protein